MSIFVKFLKESYILINFFFFLKKINKGSKTSFFIVKGIDNVGLYSLRNYNHMPSKETLEKWSTFQSTFLR